MNSSKSVLIIGAGEMAKAVALDLITVAPRFSVTAIDNDQKALDSLSKYINSERLTAKLIDASDLAKVKPLMEDAAVVLGSAGYRYNRALTQLAIESGASWVDLGGNNDVVRQQFQLNEAAKNAGVPVIPDSGLAPGMVNILAGYAHEKLDSMDAVHFRVGGLPLHPKPPLFYGLLFSPDGLANEYSEPCRVIENGEKCEVAPLTGWERLYIGEPYGTMEAFHTSGGSSTMIDSFAGKVKSLDYKTIRYPGHLHKIKLLLDLGLFENDPIPAKDNVSVTPRFLFGKLLEREDWVTEDVTLLVGWVDGLKNGVKMRINFKLIDRHDSDSGLTSMARTTGFTAAILVRMILDGRIEESGVIRQELSVSPEQFISELTARNINVAITEN